MKLFRSWFSLRDPVTRAGYLSGGALFMLLKFALERAVFSAWLGRELTPLAFLSPFFVHRAKLLSDAPDGVTWMMLGLALPFLWLGISMSVRRALDAGLPPMIGFLFLIPGVHYLLMLALCLAPTRAPAAPHPPESAYRPSPEQLPLPDEGPSVRLRAARAILTSASVGFAMFGLCVYVLKSYGTALFLATPFVMGTVAAVSYRAARRVSPEYHANRNAVGCGIGGLLVVGLGLLASAQEGGSCLAMAIIPAALLAVLGSWLAITVGSIAEISTRRFGGALLLLPLAAGAESAVQRPPVHEIVSSVIVDAPPEVVWRHVTSFPDLDPPTEWLFRQGIAYPVRARIDGEGVGATRYCEFSTGTFVEPITRWEPPRRLSFDVAESPAPMREWSPWDKVDAPHLRGFMRSRRGEFRLVALPGNRTRLEGSTFYELEIFPELYWKVWSDSIVHAIHGRVLQHIQRLSEADARAAHPE